MLPFFIFRFLKSLRNDFFLFFFFLNSTSILTKSMHLDEFSLNVTLFVEAAEYFKLKRIYFYQLSQKEISRWGRGSKMMKLKLISSDERDFSSTRNCSNHFTFHPRTMSRRRILNFRISLWNSVRIGFRRPLAYHFSRIRELVK